MIDLMIEIDLMIDQMTISGGLSAVEAQFCQLVMAGVFNIGSAELKFDEI
jgi:hypothetical protein